MDTGSFDLVTFRKDNCDACGYAAALECEEPACIVKEGIEGCLEYGSGKACADEATAEVDVGPLKSAGQSFLLGYSAEMDILSQTSFEAILGLGPPLSSSDVLVGLGVRYFSACLPLSAPGKLVWNDDTPGGSFTTTPVAGKRFWGVQMTEVQFEFHNLGKQVGLGCSPSCGAVVDTGTSLIGVPSITYQQAAHALNSLGGNCDEIHTLPDLTFKLGGNVFSLPPEAFVGKFVQKAIPWLPDFVPQPLVVGCELLLIDIGNTNTDAGLLWILGMPFFRYYYTTFDTNGGTDVSSMKIHTATTGGSCVPGTRMNAQRRPLMTVDPEKVLVPGWLHSAMAAARKGGNVTIAL